MQQVHCMVSLVARLQQHLVTIETYVPFQVILPLMNMGNVPRGTECLPDIKVHHHST